MRATGKHKRDSMHASKGGKRGALTLATHTRREDRGVSSRSQGSVRVRTRQGKDARRDRGREVKHKI